MRKITLIIKAVSLIILTFIIVFHNTYAQQGASDCETGFQSYPLWEPCFSGKDVALLPDGIYTGSILEYWYAGSVLSNVNSGGFALVEPLTVALHGESLLWQKYRMNGLEITDPGDPGKPFIDLPVHLWNTFSISSILYSYSDKQGYNLQTKNLLNNENFSAVTVNISNSGYMGGRSFMPQNVLDREPVQNWGAPLKRRHFKNGVEGDISFRYNLMEQYPGLIFYEGVVHNRIFLNTDVVDRGERHTLFLEQNSQSVKWITAYQGIKRSNAGIEDGYNLNNSVRFQSNGFLLQVEKLEKGKKPDWIVNAGYKKSKSNPLSRDAIRWDLIDQILYPAVEVPQKKNSWFFRSRVETQEINLFDRGSIALFFPLGMEGLESRLQYKNDLYGRTYNGVSYDLTRIDKNSTSRIFLFSGSPGLKYSGEMGGVDYKLTGSFLYQNGFSSDTMLVSRFEPVAFIRLNKSYNRWNFYGGGGHDAIPLTMQEVSFLDNNGYSARRYLWNDDGNGIPEMSEAGVLLDRSGPAYHKLDPSFQGSVRNEIYAGFYYNFTEKLLSGLGGHYKNYSRLYTVSYDSRTLQSYSSVPRADVRGGVLFNRDGINNGNEFYYLHNQKVNARYASVELQLIKKALKSRGAFVNFTVGAYYADGVTLTGNGSDYNDIGRISDSSADPNHKINALARMDSDRAYIIHIIFGYHIMDGLTWGNVLRYRDGEPFGNMMVAEGLNQGPTIVQNLERSQPPLGMPRFTYALSWDTRISWVNVFHFHKLGLSFDIYNLLDSRTELYEYTIEDERNRDPMESGMGRSYRLNMSYNWL